MFLVQSRSKRLKLCQIHGNMVFFYPNLYENVGGIAFYAKIGVRFSTIFDWDHFWLKIERICYFFAHNLYENVGGIEKRLKKDPP